MLLTAGDVVWNLPYDIRPNELDIFSDVAVQPDGKIVAVGRAEFAGTVDYLVARFNADGTPDVTFDGDGFRTIHFAGQGGVATTVAVRPNGKIVVGGFTSAPGADEFDFGIVQLNSKGSIDASFGVMGGAIWNAPAGSEGVTVGNIALSADGGIFAGGRYGLGGETVGFVLRFTASGTADSSFDGDGVKTVVGGVVDVAADTVGRVLALTIDGRVHRLTATGAADASFLANGAKRSLDGFNPVFSAIEVAPDGKIVLGGSSTVGGVSRPGVARLLPHGGYDDSFDDDGRVSLTVVASSLRDLAVLPDGSVFVGGHTLGGARDWVMALFRPNGQLDPAFAEFGRRFLHAGGQDVLGGVAVAPDGDFVLAGHVEQVGTAPSSAVARIEGVRVADDLVGFHAGEWRVGRSERTSFETTTWATWSDIAWEALRYGDFNGDGRTDVLGLVDGNWWVGIAGEESFQTSLFGSWSNVDWQNVTVGDLDNDGFDDVVARVGGQWWAARSLETHFASPTLRATWANLPWSDAALVDLNGDGRADLLARAGGQWWAALGGVFAFGNASLWGNWADAAWTMRSTTDVNGDGLADVVGLLNGQWWVGVSTGAGLVTSLWATWADVNWVDARVGDFDGDGRDDVTARLGGQWWVGLSGGTAFGAGLWATWADIGW